MIPKPALILGLLGTLPFLMGMAVSAFPAVIVDLFGIPFFAASVLGTTILTTYSYVILSFMSGALWGFAAKSDGETRSYVLSVIPALCAFFLALYLYFAAALAPTSTSLYPFIFLFAGLLIFDYIFWIDGLAPKWWMRLRLMITSIVIFCLVTTELFT